MRIRACFLYIHQGGDGRNNKKGYFCALDCEERWVHEYWMEEASDIRMGLLRRKVSNERFAERCGMSVDALEEMLGSGEVSDEVLSHYVGLEVEEEAREEDEKREVLGVVFGRDVPNDRLQVVIFPDGSEGKVRKKREFRPKHGLPCEVKESVEEGFHVLVGRYRDTGVRLS